jgi:hypothetical protein
MRISAQRYLDNSDGTARLLMREKLIPLQEVVSMTFEAQAAAFGADVENRTAAPADFRTPTDPEAGWAARNPQQAMLFLFVTPRDCGAVEELMAL